MHASPDPQIFHDLFGQLSPLILDEWPTIEAADLEATEGVLDGVVVLVAEASGRTRAKSRQLLGELIEVVQQPMRAAPPTPRPPPPQPPAPVPPERPPPRREPESRVAEPVESFIASLEGHLEDLTREVKRDVAPLAADTAREHLGLVLLLTGAIGFALGLFLGALGYPHDNPSEEAADDEA